MTFIQTYSGIAFDLANPTPEMLNLQDIAFSLARIARFNGHLNYTYSVADHCMNMLRLAQTLDALNGGNHWTKAGWEILMHDAGEAYYGDISSPLLSLVGGLLQPIIGRIDLLIEEKFELNSKHAGRVAALDKMLLAAEAKTFFNQDLGWIDYDKVAATELAPFSRSQGSLTASAIYPSVETVCSYRGNNGQTFYDMLLAWQK